jgi:hypothetical protein
MQFLITTGLQNRTKVVGAGIVTRGAKCARRIVVIFDPIVRILTGLRLRNRNSGLSYRAPISD